MAGWQMADGSWQLADNRGDLAQGQRGKFTTHISDDVLGAGETVMSAKGSWFMEAPPASNVQRPTCDAVLSAHGVGQGLGGGRPLTATFLTRILDLIRHREDETGFGS